MAKEIKKKSNANVGNEERESFLGLMVELIMEQGDQLGNDIIERMDLKEIDPVAMGTAVVGLAKAVAMLKDVARRTGFNIDKFYQREVAFFKKEYAKIDFETEVVN